MVSSLARGVAMGVGFKKNNILGLKRLRYAPGNDAEKVAGGVPRAPSLPSRYMTCWLALLFIDSVKIEHGLPVRKRPDKGD